MSDVFVTTDRDLERATLSTYGGAITIGLAPPYLLIRTVEKEGLKITETYLSRDQAVVLAGYLDRFVQTGNGPDLGPEFDIRDKD